MTLSVHLAAGHHLSLYTDRSAGHGGIVWQASIVLSHFLSAADVQQIAAARGAPPSRLRVLELGAGCGLPALALACRFSTDAVLTDRPALVPLLECNAACNAAALAAAGSSAACLPLSFGGSLRKLPPAARPPYDIVLASDILGCGDAGALDGVLKTLGDVFFASPGAVVWMTYRPRAAWEGAFFEEAAACGWCLVKVARYSTAEVMRIQQAMIGGAAGERSQPSDSGGAAPQMYGCVGVEASDTVPEGDAGDDAGCVQLWRITAGAPSEAGEH